MSIPERARRRPGTAFQEQLLREREYIPTAITDNGSVSPFYGARVTNSSNLTIGLGPTTLTFNTNVFDTSRFHSTTTNTSRMTVPFDGYYMLWADFHVLGNNQFLWGYKFWRHDAAAGVERQVGTMTHQRTGAGGINGGNDFTGLVVGVYARRGDYFYMTATTDNASGFFSVVADYSPVFAIAYTGS